MFGILIPTGLFWVVVAWVLLFLGCVVAILLGIEFNILTMTLSIYGSGICGAIIISNQPKKGK